MFEQAEKIFSKREDALRKLEHAEGVWEMSKQKAGNNVGKRPTHRTGFMGLLGSKVDSIEYWRAKSQELNPQVDAEQNTTRHEREQDAAFVIFNDRISAAEAAQVCSRIP